MISTEFSIPSTPSKPVRVFNRFDELDQVRRNLGGLSYMMGGYKPSISEDAVVSPISKSSHPVQYTPHTPTKVSTPTAPSKSSNASCRFGALDSVRRNLFDLADAIGGYMGSGSDSSPSTDITSPSTSVIPLIPPTPRKRMMRETLNDEEYMDDVEQMEDNSRISKRLFSVRWNI